MSNSHGLLSAAIRASNKGPIRVLATALASLRVLDTVSTIPTVLALITPEEGPAVRVDVRHIIAGGRSARESRASTVRGAVVIVVCVVRDEDGVGLGAGYARVVAAFGGLDAGGDFDGGLGIFGAGAFAFGVGGAGVEGGGCGGYGHCQSDEGGELVLHFGRDCIFGVVSTWKGRRKVRLKSRPAWILCE